LNSLYGAVINQYDRFFDPRMGASTTATGRKITGHMIAKISELLTGEYVAVQKTTDYEAAKKAGNEHEYGFNTYTCDSKAAIYSDTDSCYFNTFATNKEEAILVADTVGEQVNESFIPFMQEAFLCQPGFDTLIKAGREVVADRGIFQAKKKYILRVVNLDGKDIKPGDKKALKVMGGEIKKSDTPKVIQEFLKNTTLKILDGATYQEIETYVNTERKKFKSSTDILSIGVSKSVNKLEMYYDDFLKLEKTGIKKARLPGHVRASINFNEYLKEVNDKVSTPIKSGNKIKVYYLKTNDFRFESIAVPSDLDALPSWFTRDFVVDIKKTEEKLIDMKLESIFDPLGWQVPTPQTARNNKLISWD
jgi:DNA polymerase elongation subunit (family B)